MGILPAFRFGEGPLYVKRSELDALFSLSGWPVDPAEDWRVPLTLSSREAASALGTSERRVRDLVSKRLILAVRLGERRIYILRRPLEHLIKEGGM